MTKLGFVFNLNACSDHRSCMLACKKKTGSFLGSHYIETFTAMSEDYPKPNTYFLPLTCQHCGKPSCVLSCSKGVLYKRNDGIVALGDTNTCQSCPEKPCVAACPFKRIELDPSTGKIGKCDLCADLIDAGKPPKCSGNCLGRSIIFGDFDDPGSVVSQVVESWNDYGYVHQMQPDNGNEPTMRYLLSDRYWQNFDTLYSPAWHNE